jgi:TDG/mug DNA glycosylase family protein
MGEDMKLPDVLSKDLKVVFCGTAVSDASARIGHYYAGRGNKFWIVLKKIALIPSDFRPEEFIQLTEYGVGLTDLVKHHSGSDAKLLADQFDVEGFNEKIRSVCPRTVAFNGKKAAETVLLHPVQYGLQKETIGDTALFVLPSTSGAANRSWNPKEWERLAVYISNVTAR